MISGSTARMLRIVPRWGSVSTRFLVSGDVRGCRHVKDCAYAMLVPNSVVCTHG